MSIERWTDMELVNMFTTADSGIRNCFHQSEGAVGHVQFLSFNNAMFSHWYQNYLSQCFKRYIDLNFFDDFWKYPIKTWNCLSPPAFAKTHEKLINLTIVLVFEKQNKQKVKKVQEKIFLSPLRPDTPRLKKTSSVSTLPPLCFDFCWAKTENVSCERAGGHICWWDTNYR